MLSKVRLKTTVALLLSLLFISIVSNAAFNLIVMRRMMLELDMLKVAVNVVVQNQLSVVVAMTVVSLLVSSVLIALTYLIFTKGVLNPLRKLSGHVATMANSGLTDLLDKQDNNEFGQVVKLLDQVQNRLNDTFYGLQQSVTNISIHADDITSGNLSLSSRIEQQASALQQTAASMEELSGTVRQNADNAHQANQLATTASTVAQRGGEVVGEVVNTMHEISASSSRIADIVGVIDSIAFQTNILALNAAVEAARAGEQGRGFAVVASEVRALAQRSAQAAREITDLINSSSEKVKEGSGQVERAGATMHEIVDSVKRVTDIMGEISAATVEQSSGIDQINIAVGQLDATTLQNSEMVSQSAKIASEMGLQVNHLSLLLNNYHTNADHHISDSTAPKRLRVMPTSMTQRPPLLIDPKTTKTSSESLVLLRRKSLKESNAASSGAKVVDVPGMNILSTSGENRPLLRPNLNGKKGPIAKENEWVEF